MTLTPEGRGHLAMAGFSALVAGSFTLGGLAAPHIDPAALTLARFALAAGLVGGAALATTGVARAAFRAPWRFGLLGALLAIYFVTMFEGLKTAAPVSAAAVFTLTPLMAAGFGWLTLRQRLGARSAAALAMGAAGALWVIFRGDPLALASLGIGRGEAIYFIGCVAHALYAPLVRKVNRGEPAVVSSFLTMLGGLVVLAPLGAGAAAETAWLHLPAIVWICLLYVAVAATAITFVLLQYASLRLPAAKVMAYTYLVPSWVLVWEAAFGHPRPALQVLPGVALTLVALLLLLRPESGQIAKPTVP